MMRQNDQSNRIIRWIVTIGDFMVLNVLMLGFALWHWRMESWTGGYVEIFILVNNLALMLSMVQFSTIIHLRVVGAGEILRRVMGLTMLQAVLAYLLLKVFAYYLVVGLLIFEIGTLFAFILVLKRLGERWFIKLYRQAGRNTRSVTLVGSDPELIGIYKKLKDDATLGYNILGYYGDEALGDVANDVEKQTKQEPGSKRDLLERLGSFEDFMAGMQQPESLVLGDEEGCDS